MNWHATLGITGVVQVDDCLCVGAADGLSWLPEPLKKRMLGRQDHGIEWDCDLSHGRTLIRGYRIDSRKGKDIGMTDGAGKSGLGAPLVSDQARKAKSGIAIVSYMAQHCSDMAVTVRVFPDDLRLQPKALSCLERAARCLASYPTVFIVYSREGWGATMHPGGQRLRWV